MADRPPITTHVLDLARGRPAAGISVALFRDQELVAEGVTNDDGRVGQWQPNFEIACGKYRLEFNVESWFAAQGIDTFYEDVHISFRVADENEHYHVPLLLSPFGYSTYRGS